MSEDRFFDRLRSDARELRYEADSVATTRLEAAVRARIEEPTISDFLAAWFRPVAASLSALALMATIGLAVFDLNQTPAMTADNVEVSMGGDIYSVVD